MAEFCNRCAEKYGMKADINLPIIALRLKKGKTIEFAPCEGCRICAIRQNNSGIIEIRKNNSEHWETY